MTAAIAASMPIMLRWAGCYVVLPAVSGWDICGMLDELDMAPRGYHMHVLNWEGIPNNGFYTRAK
jgi:hypothetical protein